MIAHSPTAANVGAAVWARVPATARRTWPLIPLAQVFLLVLHAFMGDRLYLEAGTGGRGVFSVTALAVPCLIGLYSLFAARQMVWALARTSGFWKNVGIMAAVTITLPVLGMLVMDYPVRSALASTEGVVALSAVIGGYILSHRTRHAGVLAAGIVAAFCCWQLIAALVQADVLASDVVPGVTAWDAAIRVAYGSDYVVSGRAIGTLINPNTLGLAVVMGALFSGYFLRGSTRVAMIVVCCLTLVLSQSRGALIALVVSSVLVWVTNKGRPASRGLGVAGAALIGIGFVTLVATTPLPVKMLDSLQSVPVIDAWAQRTGSGLRGITMADEDRNLRSRYDSWTEALEFSQHYPLGTMGPPQVLFGRSIDNEFVRLWCQGSVIAVGAFMLVIVSVFRSSSCTRESRFARHVVVATCVAAGSAVVLGTPPAVLMWLAIGIALGSNRQRDQQGLQPAFVRA